MIKSYGNSNSFNGYYSIPIANAKSIALISMLVALSVTGRIAFSFIPNVQPTTPIIILTTLLLGIRYGLINAVLSILVSNLVLGSGIWTIPQIISYAIIVLITGFAIRPVMYKLSHLTLSLFAGCCGLLYGLVISFSQIPIFGLKNIWAYYLSGLPFDLAHAGGNVIFYYLLAPIIIPLLKNLLGKYFLKEICLKHGDGSKPTKNIS